LTDAWGSGATCRLGCHGGDASLVVAREIFREQGGVAPGAGGGVAVHLVHVPVALGRAPKAAPAGIAPDGTGKPLGQ